MDFRASGLAVSGEIIVAGSTTGVADLVVEVEHVIGDGRASRLASAVTSSQGSFRLTVPPPTPPSFAAIFRPPTWNLRLVVLGPEGNGRDPARRTVCVSESSRGPRGARQCA